AYNEWEPFRGFQKFAPLKPIQPFAPFKPFFSQRWSNADLVDFLRSGED
ncbi:MAG: 4-fold beta flower protein, partial [Bacteroidota bacterium]